MVRANSTEESMGDTVEDVSQHHSSILDNTFQCELGFVPTFQSREDEKREQNRVRMGKYRLRLKTDAEQHFQTYGLCRTEPCNCPQHKYQGNLLKDKTSKKASRDAKKAEMIAHLEENGECTANDGTSEPCNCPQHRVQGILVKDKTNKRARRDAKKAEMIAEIEEIAVVAGNPRDTGRSLEYFYSDEELKQMDETIAFGPLQTDAELYKKIAPKLSFDNLTVRCCGVCDCGSKCNEMAYEEITEEFIKVRCCVLMKPVGVHSYDFLIISSFFSHRNSEGDFRSHRKPNFMRILSINIV